jgi:hypothetical protein
VLGIIGGACAAHRELKEARTMTPRIFIPALALALVTFAQRGRSAAQTPYDAFKLLVDAKGNIRKPVEGLIK